MSEKYCEKIAEGKTEQEVYSEDLICREENCPYNNQRTIDWEGNPVLRVCKTKGIVPLQLNLERIAG